MSALRPALLFAAACAASLALHACAPMMKPGDPLPGLTDAELRRFEAGREKFEKRFRPSTGLGPLYNAVSCGECHEDPTSGGPGDESEIQVSAYDAERRFCDTLAG